MGTARSHRVDVTSGDSCCHSIERDCLRSRKSRETHGDVFRTGIVEESGDFWHSRGPADSVRDYVPEFEAPSETVAATLQQGPERFELHTGMRHPNPQPLLVAGEPDKSCLASNGVTFSNFIKSILQRHSLITCLK